MKVVLFAGPTISAEEASAVLPHVTVLPPAERGDVFRASLAGPYAIAICDGYFEHRLSIWHKEILWALSNGIHVYGAASMGALRAAELAPFGMRGVGAIYEQYRSGELEDDDEVAVVHEAAASGYRPRSDALVNMRATLEHARRLCIVTEQAAAAVISASKSLFYPERTYQRAIELACTEELRDELSRLSGWLSDCPPLDQKRADALDMLRQVERDSRDPQRRSPPRSFHFEATNAWNSFCHKERGQAVRAQPLRRREGSPGQETTDRVHVRALERSLALALAEVEQHAAHATEVQKFSDEFRRRHGLHSLVAMELWMKERGLDNESFSLLMYDESLIELFAPRARELVSSQLGQALRALELESAPPGSRAPVRR